MSRWHARRCTHCRYEVGSSCGDCWEIREKRAPLLPLVAASVTISPFSSCDRQICYDAMSASVGITLAAIVDGLGSCLMLLLGGITVAIFAFHPPSIPGPTAVAMRPVMIGAGVFYLILGALGLWTAVDLIRLRSWARYSVLIFAVLLSFFSLVAILFAAFIPIPTRADAPQVASYVRIFMISFYGLLLGVGAWWIVLFTRRRTIERFRSNLPVEPSSRTNARPIVITVIAGYLIFGAVSIIVIAALQWPQLLFFYVLRGWTATVYLLLLAFVDVYVAIGLLGLREPARKAAIGWLILRSAIAFITFSLPGALTRLQQAMPSFGDTRFVLSWPAWIFIVPVALIYGAIIVLLVRYRAAFIGPAKAPIIAS